LPGGRYRAATARLTAAGYLTTEQDFKNALRTTKVLPDRVIPADAPGVHEFVATVILDLAGVRVAAVGERRGRKLARFQKLAPV
jgi:hypothetical protein